MSRRVQPYVPMHAPRKEVTFEEMQEILARHVERAARKASVEVIPAMPAAGGPLEPRPEAPDLEWEKPEKYHVYSKCRQYSVAKTYVYGMARYTVWAFIPDAQWFIQVGPCVDSFAKAKEIANEHNRKKQRKSA